MRGVLYNKGSVWVCFGTVAAYFIMLFCLVDSAAAAGPAPNQKTFASPQQAAQALVDAVKNNNQAMLTAIFGPEGEDLISSGDPVADKRGRERFAKAYGEKNSLEQQDKDTVVLHVGNKDYPFPIPIARQNKSWFFDTPAGKDEILNRRIGKNELRTIQVLHAYTEAQREYSCSRDHKGNCNGEFARKLISSKGKKDGLYWPTTEGKEESPFGPFIARASAEGYAGSLDSETPEPFHGYLFKILTAQGPHAEGGAFNYIVNGKMVLGYGMVAYPAKYGVSGVMTFIVNQKGIIYQKDLGDKTPEAANMTTFDPDDSWKQCKEDKDK
jgi:hypothetical protein